MHIIIIIIFVHVEYFFIVFFFYILLLAFGVHFGELGGNRVLKEIQIELNYNF